MLFQLKNYQVRALNTLTAHSRRTLPGHEFLHQWYYFRGTAFAGDNTVFLMCRTPTFTLAEKYETPLVAFPFVRVAKTRDVHRFTFNTETRRASCLGLGHQKLEPTSIYPSECAALIQALRLHSDRANIELVSTVSGFGIDLDILGRLTRALASTESERPLLSHLAYVRLGNGSISTHVLWRGVEDVEAFIAAPYLPSIAGNRKDP